MDELFKGRHFDREIIVLCVRWYLRYKLGFRDLVEMMAERGLSLAHTTIMRWIQHYAPEFEKRWNRFARPVRWYLRYKDAGPISTVPSTKREEPSGLTSRSQRGPGRTSRGKSMQDQIVNIFEQFDRTGSSIRQVSARSDARPQAFPPRRNDDRRHRTHASDS